MSSFYQLSLILLNKIPLSVSSFSEQANFFEIVLDDMFDGENMDAFIGDVFLIS